MSLLRSLVDTTQAVRRRLRGMPWQSVQTRVQMEKIGSDYGGYWVCPRELGADSVVYSFGIGEDISFDLGMIERFGVTVHAFDPTPRSLSWVEKQNPPRELVVHPFGLADYDGTASFAPPVDPTHISHTLLERKNGSGPNITVDVKRLATVMKELGHDHIDVLKMDIEGAEYGVVEDIARSDIAISQLLLEYHHHLPGVPLRRTEKSIRRLNAAGFSIGDKAALVFDISGLAAQAPWLHSSAVREKVNATNPGKGLRRGVLIMAASVR